jgi:hypothetical protein
MLRSLHAAKQIIAWGEERESRTALESRPSKSEYVRAVREERLVGRRDSNKGSDNPVKVIYAENNCRQAGIRVIDGSELTIRKREPVRVSMQGVRANNLSGIVDAKRRSVVGAGNIHRPERAVAEDEALIRAIRQGIGADDYAMIVDAGGRSSRRTGEFNGSEGRPCSTKPLSPVGPLASPTMVPKLLTPRARVAEVPGTLML